MTEYNFENSLRVCCRSAYHILKRLQPIPDYKIKKIILPAPRIRRVILNQSKNDNMELMMKPMNDDYKGDYIQVSEWDTKYEIPTSIVADIYCDGTISIHHMNNWKLDDLQSVLEIARNYKYIHPNLKPRKRTVES